MSSVLVMLPESAALARRLLGLVFKRAAGRADGVEIVPQLAVGGGGGLGFGAFSGGGVDLLILEKQREAFMPLIKEFRFNKVFIMNEEYYGGLADPATRAFLIEKAAAPYERAYFPFNTFRANAYLLGAVVADEAVGVNASLIGGGAEPLEVAFSLAGAKAMEFEAPWAGAMDEIRDVLGFVRRTLEGLAGRGGIKMSGERPGLGILRGFGHDLEIFMKYAYGMEKARGARVLDIGGGLGYGAFLLSRAAEEVVFIDKSEQTVDFVRKTWLPLAPNLRAIHTEAAGLESAEDRFDVVFLMDVIEHVAEPERLLLEAHRLLSPGGLLVMSTPEQDYYPYSVCPVERIGDEPARLMEEGIWPWHIQALGEARLLPMIRAAGFDVEEKKYMTYVRGYELARKLSEGRGTRASALLEAARGITRGDLADFGRTEGREACCSAASYNITARKEGC